MAANKKVIQERELATSFRSLATAYQEISLYKMKATRTAILENRVFLEELSDIFFDVKMSYASLLETILKQRKQKHVFAGMKKNGKTVAILLTANTKLYGSIVNRVFDAFYQEQLKSTADIFIVGKVGKTLFDAKQTHRPYAYFEIPDTNSTAEQLEPLITHILPYETVTVYYGKYVNVVNQVPAAHNISGDTPLEKEEQKQTFRFLFEPRLETILAFFESQVFTSLFNQTIHEGELARHASRITSMEEALQNIETKLKKLLLLERRIAQNSMNTKQLASLAGMSLWEEDEEEAYV